MDVDVLRLEIEKLELQAGDILAVHVRTSDKPPDETIENVRASLGTILPAEVSVLIFFGDVSLQVLRGVDGE
jgi:hypothetical protein